MTASGKIIKIGRNDWAGGIQKIMASYRLFGPVKRKDYHVFEELHADERPDLKYQNTRLSPKSAIYPQSEVMFRYSLDAHDVDAHMLRQVNKNYSPRAVIGIRPCDAKSFLLVKRNFDTPEFQDPYWLQAYECTTFIGLACSRPCDTCFCTTAGSGPFHPEGLDILLVEDGDGYLAEILSPGGAALLHAAGWNTEADVEKERRKIETLKQQAESKITSAVRTDRLKSKNVQALFDAPFWEDVAFACINCGTCTYSCPTCWCFDIQDEVRGKAGVRMRNWDSCMYPLFTLHGSGHNPRNTKAQRVRQRFMHKLKYYVDRFSGDIQCVGCGRCIRLCPVNIDIRKVCHLMNSY